jgi:hypothetical protein
MQSLKEFLGTVETGGIVALIGVGVYILYKTIDAGEDTLKNLSDIVDSAQVTADDSLASNFGIVTDDLKSRVSTIQDNRRFEQSKDLDELKRADYNLYLLRERTSGQQKNIESYSEYWSKDSSSSELANLETIASKESWRQVPFSDEEKSVHQAQALQDKVVETFSDVGRASAEAIGGNGMRYNMGSGMREIGSGGTGECVIS